MFSSVVIVSVLDLGVRPLKIKSVFVRTEIWCSYCLFLWRLSSSWVSEWRLVKLTLLCSPWSFCGKWIQPKVRRLWPKEPKDGSWETRHSPSHNSSVNRNKWSACVICKEIYVLYLWNWTFRFRSSRKQKYILIFIWRLLSLLVSPRELALLHSLIVCEMRIKTASSLFSKWSQL